MRGELPWPNHPVAGPPLAPLPPFGTLPWPKTSGQAREDRSAAGDGREDGDHVALVDDRVEKLQRRDAPAVLQDDDIGLDLPGGVEEVFPQPGMGVAEDLQQPPDGFPRGQGKLHLPCADDLPKRGEGPERDLHIAILYGFSRKSFPLRLRERGDSSRGLFFCRIIFRRG